MTNVEKIAELRGIPIAEAISFWKQVSAATGSELSTYDVLAALLVHIKCAGSITADQLAEWKELIEEEKRRRLEELRSAEADKNKEIADQKAAYKNAEADRHKAIEDEMLANEAAKEKEFRLLVKEIAALKFTKSSQVSNYIVTNKLGHKYKNISGILEMELEGRTWNFNGGFPPRIYARLCEALNLGNQGSRAVPGKFTPFKDVFKE